ncbi:MAG: ATP-binding cassette domain-containing protein, partial [Anaerolineales bacterium]
QNIEFGLQVRKVFEERRKHKRDELLEMVGLIGFGNRMPNQLSGGQQQRVALARALALEPEVLLLDEPLGALDAKIRVELRRSLKNIQRKSGVAAILVTHDQDEAFDLGDRIGVMNFGRLIEVGTPQELYQNPKTEYVASFLGSANLLLGYVVGKEVHIGKKIFPLPAAAHQFQSNSRAQILFRPEDVALAKSEEDLGCLPLGEGEVIEKGLNGAIERLRVALPAIEGVRSISPSVPYGNPSFLLEVNRSPEQSTNLPINQGNKAWVGIRRLHVLSHPGLNFLLVSDGSLRSQSAITLGGYMTRMAHAQLVLLGIGQDLEKIEDHLIESRKQLGSGMASLDVVTSSEPFNTALAKAVEQHPVDMVILAWRPTAGYSQPEGALEIGDHHIFLATQPVARLNRALICLESGEPGKDNVDFSGRFLRHMGAEATLMTVIPPSADSEDPYHRIERFLSAGKNSLSRFGVQSQTRICKGDLLPAIQKELQQNDYDLIVLGAPLLQPYRKPNLSGVVGNVISSVEDCSFLIIRSHQYQRLQNRRWRIS